MSAVTAAPGGYLNTDEVRERYLGGVAPQTVWKYIANDGLPAHRAAGRRRYLFDPAEVEAWVRARNGHPATAVSANTAPSAAVAVDPAWVAEQVSKFDADALRRAGELLLALARSAAKGGVAQ